MYERKYPIERFLADKKGTLKPPMLFSMLSDIMERNANSYGAGAEFHLSRNLAWVLTEYQVDFKKWPENEENVIVGTLPYSFKKMYGFRVYRGKSEDDATIFEGKGKFVLIDIKTKRLVKPTQDILDLFTDAKKEPVVLPFEKWRLKSERLLLSKRAIISHDYIDVNGHLNNAHSVTLAYKVLDPEIIGQGSIKSIYVKYKKEAFKNDEVSINLYEEGENVYGVVIKRDEDTISELLIRY